MILITLGLTKLHMLQDLFHPTPHWTSQKFIRCEVAKMWTADQRGINCRP